MQGAMGLAAEATGQSPTTAANAQRLLLAKLREKLSGPRIVPVVSRQIKQTFDLSKRSRDTAVHKRNGEMILSFLARVFRRVLARDGSAVCPDGRSPVAACSDTVLEAVTHFQPRITVMWTRRPLPPMKSETGIAQFSVCGSYVVRRSRAAEAKLFLEFLNCKPTLIRIGHVNVAERRIDVAS
jgi:hypothetical protein